MRVEDVPVEALAELSEDLADLRHDLGKYVTFEVRFAGREAAETEVLRAALQRDLLRTYSRQGADQAAWEVWARLRPALLDGDPDVAEIDAALAGLREVALATAERAALLRAAAQAEAVSAACRRLLQRVQSRQADEDEDD